MTAFSSCIRESELVTQQWEEDFTGKVIHKHSVHRRRTFRLNRIRSSIRILGNYKQVIGKTDIDQ